MRIDGDATPPHRNGVGLAALVAGFVAVAFAFVPIIGDIVAAPTALCAIVLGLIGLGRVEDGRATNRGEALVGFVLGLLAALVVFIGFMATFV